MSNKPHILIEHVDAVEDRTIRIIQAYDYHAVFYDGAPFHEFRTNSSGSQHQYRIPVFLTRSLAEKRASILNALFKTDQFTVAEMHRKAMPETVQSTSEFFKALRDLCDDQIQGDE